MVTLRLNACDIYELVCGYLISTSDTFFFCLSISRFCLRRIILRPFTNFYVRSLTCKYMYNSWFYLQYINIYSKIIFSCCFQQTGAAILIVTLNTSKEYRFNVTNKSIGRKLQSVEVQVKLMKKIITFHKDVIYRQLKLSILITLYNEVSTDLCV